MTVGPALRALCTAWVGLMAGFFFAFSVVVMPGLARIEPLTAMAAMQGINTAVRNTAFGLAFFGALALCAVVLVQGLVQRTIPSWVASAGAAIYLAGVFIPTAGFNVPLNRMLAPLDPTLAGNAPAMLAYIANWSAWNDVRTLAGIIACGLLAASLACDRAARESPKRLRARTERVASVA